MKKLLVSTAVSAAMMLSATAANAADYVIDTKGGHASVNFKIKHLGYSWLYGRFNTFDGTFSYDAKNPDASKIMVNIDTTSLDSNHAERDKHLRSPDFLNTAKFPEATFVSTSVDDKGDGTFVLNGNFTFNGVTKPLAIDAKVIGEGSDPWGGYRAGFTGSTEFALKDYNVQMDLGPASSNVSLNLVVEGIRK